MKDKNYSIMELAVDQGVHYNTVYRWIQSGQLKASRRGKRGGYIISQEAVDKFIKEYNKGE